MTLEEKAEEKAEKYSEAFIEKGVAKASYAKGYIAGTTEALKARINTTTISDAPLEKDKQLEKARSIVHRLLVVIQKHKWWDYTVIDEARAFMSEVDRDKNNV